MDDLDLCECSHTRDEHGPSDDAPRGVACQVTGCDCIHFELSVEGKYDDGRA